MLDSLTDRGLLEIRYDLRVLSTDAAIFALNAMVLASEGATCTMGGYDRWLLDGGYREIEVVPVSGRWTNLELASKPG